MPLRNCPFKLPAELRLTENTVMLESTSFLLQLHKLRNSLNYYIMIFSIKGTLILCQSSNGNILQAYRNNWTGCFVMLN